MWRHRGSLQTPPRGAVLTTSESQEQWSTRLLLAARWNLRLIGDSGISSDDLESSWGRLPLGGQLDFEELREALDRMSAIKLVANDNGLLRTTLDSTEWLTSEDPEVDALLFQVLLNKEDPIWLRIATGAEDQLAIALVPEDVDRVLGSLGLGPEAREAFLLAAGRKFDKDDTSAITGGIGEDFVVDLLRSELSTAGHPDLANQVRRVSLISDELGYDVTAPRLDGSSRRIEVKSSTAVNRHFRFFLTANEWRVGTHDPDWSLVFVAVEEQHPTLVGWAETKDLAEQMPRNQSALTLWTTTRVVVPLEDVRAGLPE